MKALRRSLKQDSSSSSSSSAPPRVPNAISRPNPTVPPPQKVIRALANYRSTAPQELSFSKGDFFYVKDEMEGSGWYEAHNPATGARGLVPREYFEEFKKPNPRSSVAAGPQNNGIPSMSPPTSPPFSSSASSSKSPASRGKGAFYAVVQYDFAAERADELEAKAGEAILVIAQSNREWFVAKPIGRLGGAGLIPVSFVEIRDPGTGTAVGNVAELIERGDIPRVEEWKQQAAQYKAATIPLGKFDLPADGQGVPNSPFTAMNPNQYPFPSTDAHSGPSTLQQSTFRPVPEEPPEAPPVEIIKYVPLGLPVSAEVMSFHHEGQGPDAECYFKIPALWQPDPEEDDHPSAASHDFPPSIRLTLYRTYEDFYNLQIQLLDENPVEAGRVPPDGASELAERILPFMPGPVSEVNLLVLTQRQEELDVYLKQLCELGRTHEHILRSDVVYTFFCLRAGDTQKYAGMRDGDEDLDGAAMALPKEMAGMGIRDTKESVATNGSGGTASSGSLGMGGGGRARTSSGRSGLSTAPTSASPPATEDARSRASSSAGAGQSSQPPQPQQRIPAVPPVPEQPTAPNPNPNGLWSASRLAASPPISANCPQPAYLKIKVFNARTDDLIAIRVHPRVTFAELMEKIRDRLGEVRRVRYRSSGYVPGSGEQGTVLEGDEMMVDWFTSGERLILYAE